MPIGFHGESEYNRSFKWSDGVEPSLGAPVAGKASADMQPAHEPPIQRKSRAPSPVRDSVLFNEPYSSERGSSNRQDDYFLLGMNDKFSSSLPYRNSVKKSNDINVLDKQSYGPKARENGVWTTAELPREERERHFKSIDRHHHREREKEKRTYVKKRNAENEMHYHGTNNLAMKNAATTTEKHHENARNKYKHRMAREMEREEIIVTPDAPRASRKKNVSVQTRHDLNLGRKTANAAPYTVKEPRKPKRGSYAPKNERISTNATKSSSTEYQKHYKPFVYVPSRGRRVGRSPSPPVRFSYTFDPQTSEHPRAHRRRYVTEYSEKFQPEKSGPISTSQLHEDRKIVSQLVEANRLRNRGTHFSREHLAQLISEDNDYWTAPLDTPPYRYELRNDDDSDSVDDDDFDALEDRQSESMGRIERKENMSKSMELRSHSAPRIPEAVEGRLPTPRIQGYHRHHLDRTTPAVGGSILTCPTEELLSEESERYSDRISRQVKIHQKNKKFVTFNQSFAGKQSEDSHDLLDETSSHDEPLRFTGSNANFSLAHGDNVIRHRRASSSSSSRSSKSSISDSSRSSTSYTSSTSSRPVRR